MIRYLHGDATSTEWGKQRALDNHPTPYNKVTFEIGNEQGLTDGLLSDVLRVAGAMQEKVEALELSFNLSLAVGGNGWAVNDVVKFAKAIDADTKAGTDKVDWYYDFHIGGDSTDTNADWELLNNARLALKAIGSPIRGVVRKAVSRRYTAKLERTHEGNPTVELERTHEGNPTVKLERTLMGTPHPFFPALVAGGL